MKAFAELILSLENTNKTSSKIKYLESFFRDASEEDSIWTIALFTHRRPKRQVNTRLLAEWAMSYAQLDAWLFEESYHVVGDLAETISLILPSSVTSSDRTLSGWMDYLRDLTDKSEWEKEVAIKEAWSTLSHEERFVFNKLITGGFRVGVSHNTIFKALGKVLDIDQSEVAHRLSGDWDPYHTSFHTLLDDQPGASDSKPYPFYLAYPLEDEPERLGELRDWDIEWKWDGIRSQLIKRGGELFLWSRGEELITDKFPELHDLIELLPNGVVLDGELLAFSDGRPLPFSILQTRIGRKNVSKKHLREAPASIICYDLLEYEGVDIRDRPLSERRTLLEKLIGEGLFSPRLMVSEQVQCDNWQEVAELRKHSREHDAEGFMIKRWSSPYKSGRKRGDWWKWKVDPYTVDAVMIYAQKGHGRRADIYSDYTFAVWDGDRLVPFAKAYSGLTDKEMTEVTAFVQKNTLERFGPVRTVTPDLVFEIHFEAINESSRHKSGIAVRFPRIHRWRRDKPPEEANTLEDLKRLLLPTKG
ncbi:MAG: ATP-dependent DNA ligase [Bacteroidota bacterium]